MADIEVGDLVARISFDDTGLNKSMAEINRQMKLVESEFDKASSALSGYGSQEEQLRAKASSLNQQIQLQQQRVNNLNAAFQKSVAEKGADAVATQKLATQLNKAQADCNRLENELKSTTKELNDQQQKVGALGKAWNESMDQARSSVGTMSDGFKRAGTAITAAGAVIAAGLGLAVNKAADFEQGMADVKSVMSPDEVTEFGDQLSVLAIQMGSDTKYSATEAAKGIEELVKAGVSAQDIMKGGLAGALNLATAGELELGDAAEIASTALNAFKADNIDVIRAADLLAGAANASATDVKELKFGLSAVSAVASGVGLSFEDTATALAVFAQNGLKGSDAGTSLKTMLLNLQPHTDAAYNQMNDLGLMVINTQKAMDFMAKHGIKPVGDSADDVIKSLATYLANLDGAKTVSGKYFKEAKKMADANGLVQSAFYDASGSIKGMDEIAGLLQTSMAGLTDAQRQMALQTIFGTDAIRAGNILYKEGAKGLQEMGKAMNEVTAADVAAQRMDTLKGAIENMNGSIETAQISIGNALLPAIRTIAEVVDKVVDGFNKLSPAMQSTIAIGAVVAAGIALIVGPLLILIGMLPAIIAGFTVMVPVIAAIAAPVGIAVAAIAALAAGAILVYKNWEPIKAFFSTLWTDVSAWFTKTWSQLSAFLASTWSSIKSAASAGWKAAVDGIMTILRPFIAAAMGVWNGMKDGLMQMWEGIKLYFTGLWKAIKTIFAGALLLLIDLVTGDFESLRTDAIAIWNGLKDAFGMIWKGISNVFSGALSALKGYLEGIWNGIRTLTLAAWDAISAGVSKALTAIGKVASDIGDGIVKGFTAALKWLRDLPGEMLQLGINIIEGLIKGIGSVIGKIGDKVKDIGNAITGGLRKILDIHSPSRETEKIGVYAGQGLANGLTKSQKEVEAAAKKQAAAAAKAIKDNFSTAMKNAQYKFKMGELDTTGYVAALNTVKSQYAKTGDQVQKVNLAIKAASDKMTKDLAAAAKAQFDTSKTYIESKKQANELSLAQELAAWQKLQARYTQGSKERLAADKEINRIRQQMDKDSYDKSQQYIQNNKLSLADELAAWERVQARYKVGTDQRAQAEKEAGRVRQEIYTQLLAANESFLQSTKAINDNIIAEEQRLNSEYASAVEQRTNSILGFAGIFDQVNTEAKASGQELLDNLQGQVMAMVQWQGNLAALSQRGINAELLKQLQELGPKAAPELAALNTLTDEQLQQYVMLWQTKNALARSEAVSELEGMRTDTIQKVAQLKTDASVKMEEVRKAFDEKVKAIRSGTAGEFNAMKADMPTIGKQAMQGLLDGLASMQGPLMSKAQEIANAVSQTIRKALQIKSPSRVMMEIGQFTGAGLAAGMQASLSGITRQAANMAAAAIPAMYPAATPSFSGGAAMGAASASSGGFSLSDLDGVELRVPLYLDGRKVAEAVSGPLGSLIKRQTRGRG
ncbi:phage tail tape measure protein [Paenibacillus sp. D9]|uniref:phage tail tape measure protein n=1 Tax=Paenibacillus sp. D9 TaxID=665792 RepID=UPI000676667D|nr:phage tail tape measure protein [Paenibacillus sp. D9]